MEQNPKNEAPPPAVVSGGMTRQSDCAESVPEPCGIIIFGASGDLTHRKLIPALFHLDQGNLLPDQWYVVGLGRTAMDDEGFRKTVAQSLEVLSAARSAGASSRNAFMSRFHYLAGDSHDPKYYPSLKKRLIQLDQNNRTGGNRSEPGVAPQSQTETFAALKLYVDNWRWQGVPFYLRSGKRLAKKATEIAIEFKQVPHLLFKPLLSEKIEPNTLVLSVQPSEGISLTFQAKRPGAKLCMGSVTMDFNYHGAFQVPSPDAYERLLLDCLAGDPMLFSREEWIDWSWTILAPILDRWKEGAAVSLPGYEAGSWGPKEADELIERDGRHWRSP